MQKTLLKLTAVSALLLSLASPQAFAEGKRILINGAGATFPYPIYSKWFSEYSKVVRPGVEFNYQSIGSGGGIKQISARTVDFGASDAALTNEQLRSAPGKLLHIPMVGGAVGVTYNLDGVTGRLNISPEVLAGIFLGQIKRWNDPLLMADNANANLPSAEIIVVHRSDGSGTSNIFTDYLSSVSPEWKQKVGKGTSVSWPAGLGGKGNEGVAGTIKQTPDSLGYVELAYGEKNNLPFFAIKNKAGKFIVPSLEATTAAIEGKANDMPADFRVSLVNPDGETAYPIAGLTWILLYQKQLDGAKGQEMVQFLRWAVHDGQKYTKDLLYAPLPQQIVAAIDQRLSEIQIKS